MSVPESYSYPNEIVTPQPTTPASSIPEHPFRAIFEQTFQLLVLVRLDGIVVEANQAALELVELRREEVVGKPIGDTFVQAISAPEREQFRTAITQAANYQFVRYEFEVPRTSDHCTAIDFSFKPIRDETGQVTLLMVEGHDISARKQAEANLQCKLAELAEWQNRHEAVGQISGQLLYDWNSQTNETIWGNNSEQVLGYTHQELGRVAPQCDRLIHPDDLKYYRNTLNYAIATQSPLQLEYRLRKKDGTYITVEDRGQFYPDSSGNFNRVVGFIVDISDRKHAEQALQKAYQRLQLLIDNSPLAVIEWDIDFRLRRWSGQAEKLFGWTEEELLGLHPREWQWIYEEDIDTVNARWRSLRHGTHEHTTGENRNYTKGGSVVYCQWYNSVVRDESGNLVSILSLIQDISERKRAEAKLQQVLLELEHRVEARTQELQEEVAQHEQTEAALRRSEDEFRRIFDEAPIGMALSSREYCFVRVNRALCEMLGYSEAEVLTLSVADVTHPEDMKRQQVYIEQVERGEIDSYRLDKRYLKKNGEICWVDSTSTVLRGERGEILYALGMVEDVSERKKAEEALRHSEERFRAIIEDQTELICRMRLDGTLTFVNDAYCRYFGKTRAELVGQQFLPEMPPEDEDIVTRNFRSLSVENPVNIYEHRVILSSGEVRWQQWSDRALFDEEGNFIECQAVGRDITKLKQAEDEIRKALEREKELSELRSSFVSLVSHEFRTPLTTILSSAQLLQRYDQDTSNPKKQKHYQRIESAVQRMTELLEEVLTIGKAEAGRLTFEPAPMDLDAFCRDLTDSMQTTIRSQHQILYTTDGNFTNVVMDENLLRHIVTNLLSNAVKYSPQGETVTFDLNCTSQVVILRISDRGIGIPKEDCEKLFESFRRASNVGTIQGTGLGLAIVKKCVDLHGGQITLDSEVGVGTTFTVKLPFNSYSPVKES